MGTSTQNRRGQVAEWIRVQGWGTVSELASRFATSEASIRRDLDVLEEGGFVRRVRGGALPDTACSVGDIYTQRASKHLEEKRRIARAAAALIQSDDSIILDSGSTVVELANLIPGLVADGQHLRIITGSLPVIEALVPYPQIDLILLGGIYLYQHRTVVGPQTLAGLRGLHVDKLFTGSDGLTLSHGTTTANVLEAEVARATASVADTTIVMADSSKIGHVGFATVMALEDIDILITDHAAQADFVTKVHELGVDVRLV